MEKSWLPKCSTGHVKPSAKALEMEKQWSHKFTSHTSKIWPPPPDDVQSNLPWNKTSESETTEQRVDVVEEVNVVDSSCVTKSIIKSTHASHESERKHVKIALDARQEEKVSFSSFPIKTIRFKLVLVHNNYSTIILGHKSCLGGINNRIEFQLPI